MSKFLDNTGLAYFWGKLKVLLNGKVDKAAGKVLSDNNYTTPEKTKLAGLENYDDTALKSEISALAKYSAKNLLRNKYSGQTVESFGVSFTSDENGVISISGAPEVSWASTAYILGTSEATETMLDCSDGMYILSVESTNDKVMTTVFSRTGDTSTTIAYVNGTGSYTFSGRITAVSIVATTGTFENDTVKIMIRRAEIQDGSFQPYAPTNRELYEMILALQNT